MTNTAQLTKFTHLPIDWNLTPEHAVTMYLEWGNNDWHSEYPPVRSKDDVSIYFVVDTWGEEPVIRLVRRNSDGADDLTSFAMPAELQQEWFKEFGTLKGIFTPNKAVKSWLRGSMQLD